MTGLSFKSSLTNDYGLVKDVLIQFKYITSEPKALRQDPQLGSIHLINVLDIDSLTPLPSLSINARIQARRLCWNYLDRIKRRPKTRYARLLCETPQYLAN
ncbi:hypothetical protein [Legionella drancourtii]|uniref:Uncharacterized protein n=1 Tax=Legionella drancourtii LLAP12 TaxID=658187 RepID=G9EQF6_9GAMM|nr:hypothetical protein [Legionella drancourtii]EHL30551.1 hypothetical protein LDG_7503 [Legionella drancourtii LLAP12]